MSDSSDSEFEDLAAAIKSVAKNESGEDSSENENDDQSQSEEDEKPAEVKPKRRRANPEEENELDKFLFGDKKGFIKNLEGNNLFFTDVIGDVDGEQVKNNAVWHDSDDEDFESETLDGNKQLKRKFERITGVNPSWAQLDKKPTEDDSSDDEGITKAVGHLAKHTTSKSLPQTELNFKRLTDINNTTKNEGRIMSIEFHPTSTVGIVAGLKGVVSLFAIDGRENKKIHTIKYEKYPIHSCKLNLKGDELLVGGRDPFFHTYNLLSGYKQRTRLPVGVKHMQVFELSPCGKYIAIAGDFGEVHLLTTLSKELLFTFKQENHCTSLNFSADSGKLFSHSDDNEVTVFNLRTNRVEHRFVDDGCVNGTLLAISPNGKLVATGSRQGFVNIYNYEDVLAKKFPQPVKAISNLKTEITDMRFNPTNEMLAICSADTDNSVKLVHFPSGTVFSNFPSQHDSIGKATTVGFSPAGGFLGIGSLAAAAPLYRLRHFSNY